MSFQKNILLMNNFSDKKLLIIIIINLDINL